MELDTGARVLEVGCGTGCNFPYLQKTIGVEGELVGFDQSTQMLAAAKQRVQRAGWQNVKLLRGDAAELDVGDEPFDGVLSVLAMSVVVDYRSAVARCARCCAPAASW